MYRLEPAHNRLPSLGGRDGARPKPALQIGLAQPAAMQHHPGLAKAVAGVVQGIGVQWDKVGVIADADGSGIASAPEEMGRRPSRPAGLRRASARPSESCLYRRMLRESPFGLDLTLLGYRVCGRQDRFSSTLFANGPVPHLLGPRHSLGQSLRLPPL